eukprot:Selendium_serpulae@DN6014_c1_g3_i2.p1
MGLTHLLLQFVGSIIVVHGLHVRYEKIPTDYFGAFFEDHEPMNLEVSAEKAGDVLAVESCTPQECVIKITSQMGIGRGTISLNSGDWPEKIRLDLQLAELEGIEIRSDTILMKSFRKSGPLASVYRADESGSIDQRQKPTEKSEMIISQNGPIISVVVPQRSTTDNNKSKQIQWKGG